ncbi:MAG: hypothetical protein JW759_10375 [Candidatus Coatesbacteria bacterium]|nr:hypothetical protein [Candidatus Coatesbacteria bacterium]
MTQLSKRPDLLGLCVFLTAILIGSVGLFTYFSFDDYIYLHRAEEHASSLRTFFAPFYTFNPWLYYRPLPTVFWVVVFWLFGAWPAPYSLGVILVFAAMVFFIYRVGYLLAGRAAGLISCLLVSLYFPIYSVAWSRWFSSLQMELFFLASAMFYLLRWAKSEPGPNERTCLPVTGILLMVGAFLSKETSFLAPLLLPLLAPKRRVVRLSAGLFFLGILIFLASRTLITSRFPLRAVRFEFSPIVRNLEFFLREHFLFFLPASLIILAALAWGNRNRHIWLLVSVALFTAMNTLFGYTVAAHRLKLAICLAAVIYCVLKAPAMARFALGWAALLLVPPLLVGELTLHQSAESFLGLSLFIGIGAARQTRLFRTVMASKSKVESPGYKVGSWIKSAAGSKLGLVSLLRITGAFACVLLLIYAAFAIVSLNVRIGVAEAQRMVQSSRLTRDVREYLCGMHGSGLTIHSTNLPALISVPDIPFDARLHGCQLNVDDDLSAEDGVFVVADGAPQATVAEIRSRSRLITRLVREPYYVMVFSTSD